VTIVGPNGSGKTTLLRTILGALTPERGAMHRAPRLRIGYVPQKLGLDASLPLTVGDFLALAAGAETQAREAALARTGASDLADRLLSELSGGELQRALLARAVMGAPDILMLDEPTQGLDQAGSAAFYRMIEGLRDETGVAVLMVSHELHVVMSGSDRVICLNGHICCDGVPDVVSRAPEYRALFGTDTGGALALYRHEHDHAHNGARHDQGHDAGSGPDR
jgi:zinc transport system ATP-binding protein